MKTQPRSAASRQTEPGEWTGVWSTGQRRPGDRDRQPVGEVDVPEEVGMGQLPQRPLGGVQEDRRRHCLPQSDGDPHVVVVGVGAHDREHPPPVDRRREDPLDSSAGRRSPTQVSSSPTSQTLLSTSKVWPSRLNVPLVTRVVDVKTGPGALTRRGRRCAARRRAHLLERRLDVGDPDRLRHEGVEVEPSLLVERDEHREVARGQAVAVPAGLQRAAATEDVDQRDVRDRPASGVGTLHWRNPGRRVPARSRA